MPLYTYEHPETGEQIEVVQTMSEDHVYVDKKNIKWKRVFDIPQASIDASIDPFDQRSFTDKTKNKKGTYGDLLDRSKELSQARKDKAGVDPIQQKYFKDYKDKRRGVKHPMDRG
tara:strand:+ start:897 stop:1241 length:345 start_codon:yes stop_codon:yes gene_type:complete